MFRRNLYSGIAYSDCTKRKKKKKKLRNKLEEDAAGARTMTSAMPRTRPVRLCPRRDSPITFITR